MSKYCLPLAVLFITLFAGQASATYTLALGESFSCVTLQAQVWCWGDNDSGQLGRNNTIGIGKTVPELTDLLVQPVAFAAEETYKVVSVTASFSHVCMHAENMGVKCWGEAQYSLGTISPSATNRGHTTSYSTSLMTFIEVKGYRDHSKYSHREIWAEVRLGLKHGCGILYDNSTHSQIRCWGYNDYGQVGTGLGLNLLNYISTSSYLTREARYWKKDPQPVQLGIGEFHSCALYHHARIQCWGQAKHGVTGLSTNATTADTKSTTSMMNLDFLEFSDTWPATALSSNGNHACAIFANGHARCWGSNANGQLGYDSTDDWGSTTASAISLLPYITFTGDVDNAWEPHFVAIATGESFTCGLLVEKNYLAKKYIRCWGEGTSGQLGQDSGDSYGNGTVGYLMSDIWDLSFFSGPIRPYPTELQCGGRHCCAWFDWRDPGKGYYQRHDDSPLIRCWGDGFYGQLSLGNDLTVGRGDRGPLNQESDWATPWPAIKKQFKFTIWPTNFPVGVGGMINIHGPIYQMQEVYDPTLTKDNDKRNPIILRFRATSNATKIFVNCGTNHFLTHARCYIPPLPGQLDTDQREQWQVKLSADVGGYDNKRSVLLDYVYVLGNDTVIDHTPKASPIGTAKEPATILSFPYELDPSDIYVLKFTRDDNGQEYFTTCVTITYFLPYPDKLACEMPILTSEVKGHLTIQMGEHFQNNWMDVGPYLYYDIYVNGVSPWGGTVTGGTLLNVTIPSMIANTTAIKVRFALNSNPTQKSTHIVTDIHAFMENNAGIQVYMPGFQGIASQFLLPALFQVQVSWDGGDNYQTDAGKYGLVTVFSITSIISLNPSSAPLNSGQNVTITGSGFFDAGVGNMTGRFELGGEVREVPLTFDSLSGNLIAPIPPYTSGALGTLEITFNNQQYTTGGTVFSMFEAASFFPLGGPIGGGTVVTISGSGLQFSGEKLQCKFGNQTDVATYLSKTRITCETPSVNNTGGVQTEITVNGKDWSNNGLTFQYLGDISVTSITPDRGPSSSYTNVTVVGTGFVYIPGGAGCRVGVVQGKAFINGTDMICTVPPGLGELSLYVTINGQDYFDTGKKFVFYDLFRMEPPLGPTSGGTEVLISGTGFMTTGSSTMCKFGTTDVPATLLTSAQLKCVSPAHSSDAEVPVELTIDGGVTYTQNNKLYRYYETPSVASIFPYSGGSAGGTQVTIKGSGFVPVPDGMVRCKFGLTATVGTTHPDNSTITCPSPPGFGLVRVYVSLNGGIHYTVTSVEYSYAAIVKLTPATGPRVGGTLVSVTGSGFLDVYKDKIRCKFGANYIVKATVLDEVSLTCVNPPGTTNAEVVISTNDYDWRHTPLVFEYYQSPTVSSFIPTHGTRLGGTRVIVTGTGFIDSPELRCKVGDKTGEVYFFSKTLVRCTTPPNTGLSAIAVSNNRQDFHAGAPFSYFSIQSINPANGPVEGGTRVTIAGEGFDPADLSHLKCRMNGLVIPADQLHSGAIVCTMPLFDTVKSGSQLRTMQVDTSIGSVPIEVTANDNEFVGAASTFGNFEYYEQPIITKVVPEAGSASGGSPVTLYGSRFPNTNKLMCKFGEEYDVEASIATFVSKTEIRCATTAHPEGPNRALVTVNGKDYALSESSAVFTFQNCPVGQFAKVHTDPCQPCDPGFAQPDLGQKSCIKCDRESFAPETGSSSCTDCPTNTVIDVDARDSLSLCQCKEGFFTRESQPNPVDGQPDIAVTGVACDECPEGGVCPGGTEFPVPAEQYWNSEFDEFVFLKCVNPEQCPGGSRSACAQGYTGRLCAQCDDGFYARGNYCEKCPKTAYWTLIAFGVFVILLVVGLMKAVGKNASAYGGTINIATFFFQVVGIIAKLKLKWPKSVGTTMNIMSSPFSLNLDILASECSIPLVSWQTKWVFKISIPLMFGLLFTAVYFIQWLVFVCKGSSGNLVDQDKRRRDLRTLKNSLVDGFMLLLALAYLLLITTSFEIFDCTPGKDGTSTLDAKPDLNCYDPWWWQLMPIGAAGLLVYGILIPGGMFLAIYRNRRNVTDPAFIETFGSVIIEYTPQRPYWEAVMMLEKLLIAGTLIFFTTFENVQIIAFLLVLMLGLAANVLAQPYFIQRYNQLQILLRWASALMLLAGMLFRASQFPGNVAEYIVTVMVFAILGSSAALVFGAIIYDVYTIRRTLSKLIDEKVLEMISELAHPQGKTMLMEWLGNRKSNDTDMVIKYVFTLLYFRRNQDLVAKVDYGTKSTASDRLVNEWTGRLFLEPVVPTVRAWLVAKIKDARNEDYQAQLDIRRFHGMFADIQRFIMYGDGVEVFNNTEELRDVVIPDQEEVFNEISIMVEEDRLRAKESEQALLMQELASAESKTSEDSDSINAPDEADAGLFESFGLANLQSLAAFGGGDSFLDRLTGRAAGKAGAAPEVANHNPDAFNDEVGIPFDDPLPAPEPETMASALGGMDFDPGEFDDDMDDIDVGGSATESG